MQTTGIQEHAATIDAQTLAEVDRVLTGMRDAWGRGDAPAYAGLFTEDASS